MGACFGCGKNEDLKALVLDFSFKITSLVKEKMTIQTLGFQGGSFLTPNLFVWQRVLPLTPAWCFLEGFFLHKTAFKKRAGEGVHQNERDMELFVKVTLKKTKP